MMTPRSSLENRVREDERKADALLRWRGLAPSEAELENEVTRIEHRSHDKATLHELYGALDNDPRLIREALA